MEAERGKILEALEKTEIIRAPKKPLIPYGETTIYYYLLTEPIYAQSGKETVFRTGKVIYGRPRILTPSYLNKIEGFSPEAREAIEILIREGKANSPGVFYNFSFKLEPERLEIFSEPISRVIFRLKRILAREPFSCLIKGVDELWDVSLMKFLFEMIFFSHYFLWPKFERAGLFQLDQMGIPWGARLEIERLFSLVKRGEINPSILHLELERWNLFDQYQDRFFDLFRK